MKTRIIINPVKLLESQHNRRYYDVVLVKTSQNQPIFLKCSLLDPVICHDPKPSWTTSLNEAERLTGDRNHLLKIAANFNAIPVCNYGTPQEICLSVLEAS